MNLLNERFEALIDELPHGSGINYDWQAMKYRGNEQSGVVWLGNAYDHMNDVGMYDGDIPFTVSYQYEGNRFTFRRIWTDLEEFLVSGECENCIGTGKVDCEECEDGIIYDDFDHQIPCDVCDGGEVDCDDCNGSGVEEFDDLESTMEYLDQQFWETINVPEN